LLHKYPRAKGLLDEDSYGSVEPTLYVPPGIAGWYLSERVLGLADCVTGETTDGLLQTMQKLWNHSGASSKTLIIKAFAGESHCSIYQPHGSLIELQNFTLQANKLKRSQSLSFCDVTALECTDHNYRT
jgi:hypothetical protein